MTDSNAVYLASDRLAVSVDPGYGARITQVTDETGDDWLFDACRDHTPTMGCVRFEDGTRSGWDECLPSISPCQDPNVGRSAHRIADHGDFWFQAWRIARRDHSELVVETTGRDHPLQIGKTIRISSQAAALEVDMQVSNQSTSPYRFLYSAHPLWAWPSTGRLTIPAASEVRPAFGVDEARGGSDSPTLLKLDEPDYRLVLERTGPAGNFKLFIRWAGEARLSFPALARGLICRQSGPVTSWLGVCVNRNAYPDSAAGESWIALEPTNSPTDSLVEAYQREDAWCLNAGDSMSWTTSIELVVGQEPGTADD